MLRFIVIFFGIAHFFSVISCEKNEVNDVSKIQDLEGKWILKGKFLGDAIDSPCGYAVKPQNEINLELKLSSSKDVIEINGKFPINSFFGSIKIMDKSSNPDIVFIKVESLGSTKMAGPEDQMTCETALFNFLNQAPEIRINDQQLQIGIFKKDNTPSRDGGTYLFFEKAS
jgi:heat shock protein HslJ